MILFENEHLFFRWMRETLTDKYYNHINDNNFIYEWIYEAEKAFFKYKNFIIFPSAITKSHKDEIYFFDFQYDKKHNLIIKF